ncbi:MAG: type II TA system antitoxin MqsA family protein [Coriobacteriia bacterium]
MKKLLCPTCMRVREYDTVEKEETFTVRGEAVSVTAPVAVCRVCGEEIGVAELDDAAIAAAFDIYRARHHLLQPEHIREIRSKYGLGQKAFARLLGWGEVTLARYESGALQSESHDAALRLAENPGNVRQLLEINGHRLTDEQRRTVSSRLEELSQGHESLLVREDAAPYGAAKEVGKLGEMVVFFAELPFMWRTKLSKLLFYADFLHAKRHGVSISGARYVRMQYGPVPTDFYMLQAMLIDGAAVDEVPVEMGDCEGTLFVVRRPVDRSTFSGEELETLEYVASAFRDWSISEFVEYSSDEPAWFETRDRETIPLSYAATLRLE